VVTRQVIAKDVVVPLKVEEGPLERGLDRLTKEEGTTIITTTTIMETISKTTADNSSKTSLGNNSSSSKNNKIINKRQRTTINHQMPLSQLRLVYLI